MAMTKAEKAKMEELEVALSMHWPACPIPAPLTPEQIKDRQEVIVRRDRSAQSRDEEGARGWFINSYGPGRVTFGWMNSMYQNRDSNFADNSSRITESMYATKKDALMALRVIKTRECAVILSEIDSSIRECNP